MARKDVLRLIAGFRRFRQHYFEENKSLYQKLSEGQSPKTLIIGCSDSRVDPALLTEASPGELFVVRNVANLVPPFEPAGGFHGVSSAIEYAVANLKVENVIVLGHSQCGGIRALVENYSPDREDSFIQNWVSIAADAKERSFERAGPGADVSAVCRQCEMEAIVTSLRNLRTFPFVQEAIASRQIALIGIYFDLEVGEIFELDENETFFKSIEV